jgi:hypothetical protein
MQLMTEESGPHVVQFKTDEYQSAAANAIEQALKPTKALAIFF